MNRALERAVNRREFLQSSAAAAAWSFAPGMAIAEGAIAGLWHQRPLRIYHPNPREFELRTLDVQRFVADCQARDLAATAELALDKDGTFLAMRGSNLVNQGAYAIAFGSLKRTSVTAV